MAFCSSCGAQLEGSSRFCAKCGADQAAKAASTPVAAAAPPQAPPPQAAVPPQQVQPFAGMPPQYPPPTGQIPIIMGAPPAAPAGNKTAVYVVLAAAILYGFYYIGTHDQNQNPGTTPPGQTQPAPGQGGGSQALVAQQQFANPSYSAVNGYIQVSQAQWVNGSNTALASAGLGCEQLDANGQGITQDQATLTGPVQAGQTLPLPTFQIGAVAQGAAKVNCQITAVTPAN